MIPLIGAIYGLRTYGSIYTALKTVNPFSTPSDGYTHASFINTGLYPCDNIRMVWREIKFR